MSLPSSLRAPAEMSDAEFRMLTELLRRHCGLHFGPESRYLFEKRVLRRVRELDLTSFAAYHYLLRSGAQGDQELARLVDELTINETYFFRERAQLAALVNEIVPELRAERGGRPLGIWSAGCASGEEPYSVVMLAQEAGLVPGGWTCASTPGRLAPHAAPRPRGGVRDAPSMRPRRRCASAGSGPKRGGGGSPTRSSGTSTSCT
jgi:chemotaxis protein methyltransferase CheR